MRFGTWVIVSGLVTWAQASVAQVTAERPWLAEREALEERLETAEIVHVEDVGEGVTNPRKVTLVAGSDEFHAIYKPLKRGRQRGFWESYQAEVAAYHLDRILGLDMVPPTVVRRVDGNLGSLQLWIEGSDTYKRLQDKVPMTPVLSRQVSNMKMFDNLIFNDDRNAGNFLLDSEWNIVLIDHSRAFIERSHLLKGKAKLPSQYDRKVVERLRVLTRDELEPAMDGLLMGGQLDNLLKRRDEILEHLEKLVAERGEASVLFD